MKLRLFRNILSRHLFMALVGVAYVIAAPAQAASSITDSVSYRKTGMVDNVNLNKNQIVIGDRTYVFASNVRVIAGDKASSKHALLRGMRLGFNTASEKNQTVISEIWILPTR